VDFAAQTTQRTISKFQLSGRLKTHIGESNLLHYSIRPSSTDSVVTY